MEALCKPFWNERESRLRILWRILALLVLWFVIFVAFAFAADALSGDGSTVAPQLVIFTAGGVGTVVLILVSALLGPSSSRRLRLTLRQKMVDRLWGRDNNTVGRVCGYFRLRVRQWPV